MPFVISRFGLSYQRRDGSEEALMEQRQSGWDFQYRQISRTGFKGSVVCLLLALPSLGSFSMQLRRKWALWILCVLCHFSHLWFCVTLWTVACQTPPSMEFSRQEYWNRLPCPPPRDLPDPGIKPMSFISPDLAGRFFTTSATWEAPVSPIFIIKKQWFCVPILYLVIALSLLSPSCFQKDSFIPPLSTSLILIHSWLHSSEACPGWSALSGPEQVSEALQPQFLHCAFYTR